MSKETRQNLEANINEATLETQASLEQALLAAYPPASEKWVDQVAARQTAAATARMEAAYEAAAIMGEYEAEESLEIWKNQALPEPLPTILASEWMTEWWDMSDWVLRGDQLEDPEAIAEMRAEMIEQAENRVERMAWDWVMRFIFDTGGDKEASLTVGGLQGSVQESGFDAGYRPVRTDVGESRGSDDRASTIKSGTQEDRRQRGLGSRVERSRPAYRLTTQVSPRGEKARIEANLAALSLLTQLDDRTPSAVEQTVLARFSGWGGLSALFDTRTDTYKRERETLQALVDEAAYKRALQSTANAHYTQPTIARLLWQSLQSLGLVEDARVVEPGCGVGMFIGTAPETIRMVGVEIDPTPAAIAARLYPNADIRAQLTAKTDHAKHTYAAVHNWYAHSC